MAHKKSKYYYERKRTITYVIVVLVALLLLGIIVIVSAMKSNQSEKGAEKLVIEENGITDTENDLSFEHGSDNVKKFQDKYSMDWGFEDAEYLLKVAEYHGGTKEDRAYTILVTLNKVFSERKSIQDVVLDELYNNDGLKAHEFEEIVASDETKEALKMIVYDRFDNSAGSVQYKEFH